MSKWIGRSITVWGAAMAAGGAIWGLSAEDVSQATQYGQEALTLAGAVVAFIGRLRASKAVTIIPGGN